MLPEANVNLKNNRKVLRAKNAFRMTTALQMPQG
jgi:hypothetical protein